MRISWSKAGTMGVWEGEDEVSAARGAALEQWVHWRRKTWFARYVEQGFKKWICGREKAWFVQFVEQRWSNGCVGGRR